MPSYVEKVANTMKELLWDNILEELVRVSLPALPVVGPFFAIKIVSDLILWALQEYLAEPLFKIMSRFGVFTSIDWQGTAVYNAYEAEAKKLIPLQDKEVWDKKDREVWRNAARKLIRFNLRSGAAIM